MQALHFRLPPGSVLAGRSTLLALGLTVGAVLRADDTPAATTAPDQDAAAPKPAVSVLNRDAFPNFESYVKLSGQGATITGNADAYASRARTPANGALGLEALHYSRDTSQDTTLQIDGRALAGADDYLGEFKLSKTDVGTFDMGFKRFRTFYDGIGGFFPIDKFWQPLAKQGLYTDRSTFWAEVNIAVPKQPVFHLGYRNNLRDGQKDSTIWGDTDLTGIPIYSQGALNPITANRKLIPSYVNLDERDQVLEASMKHSVGNTEYELSVERNWTNNDDTRFLNRYPGELKPFPAIPASPLKLIAGNLANNPQYGFDSQMNKAQVMTYTGKFETTLSDRTTLFGGLSFQHATADIGGDREILTDIPTKVGLVTAIGGFTTNGRPPYSYRTVSGNTAQDTTTANLGASFKATKDLFLSVALRGEDLAMNGQNLVNYINTNINTTTGVTTSVPVAAPNSSTVNEKSWTPEFNLRYTGIQNVSFYTTVDYHYAPGHEEGLSTGVNPSGNSVVPSVVTSFDNTKANHGHYKVGFNWMVTSAFTFRAETYFKDHTNNFSGYGASAGNLFIMGYEFRGLKLTGTYKPLPTLSFTTRYVGQKGKANVTTDASGAYDSMNSTSNNFGETIDWSPTPQVYFQGNANVVFASLSTIYPRAGGTGNQVLHNADNNYWDGSLLAGFVVTKAADLQLEGTIYQANNYTPALSVATVAYGAAVKEYTATLGLKVKLDPRIILHVKGGYVDSRNDTTGAFTNFRGPMGYVSLDYAL